MGCWIQRFVLETWNNDKCCERQRGRKSNKVPPNVVFKIKTKERVTAGQRGFLPYMLAGVKGQPPPLVYSCVGQLKGPTWSPSCPSGSDRLALETVVGGWPPPPQPPPQSQHPSVTQLLTSHFIRSFTARCFRLSGCRSRHKDRHLFGWEIITDGESCGILYRRLCGCLHEQVQHRQRLIFTS